MKEYLVGWTMQNGHRHSFVTAKKNWKDDSNVPSGYFFRDGTEVMNQGDYFEYVMESEHTDYVSVDEFDLENIDEMNLAQEKRYISFDQDEIILV